MRKIAVVVTARPSYSRVKTALQAIQSHPDLELQLVVGASALLDRFGNAIEVMKRDGFEIAAKVYNMLEGENPGLMPKTTGLGMIELSTVFGSLQPDIVVTIGDRFETIATAITASFMNIPLAHIQGGEVTGNIDEKVRHAISKLADYHMVACEKAGERVRKLGEAPESVFVTGCPSIDLACEIEDERGLTFNPFEKYGGVGKRVDLSQGYLVVMQHPVTTDYANSRTQITETLHAVHEIGLPCLWFWPNPDSGSDGTSKGIRAFRERYAPENIHFFKNMDPPDFLRLLSNSKGIVGNSSVAIRECAYLGVPAVNIGNRQEGRDRGRNVIDAPYEREAIKGAILQHLNNGVCERDDIYGSGQAGKAIAEVLASVELKFQKRLPF